MLDPTNLEPREWESLGLAIRQRRLGRGLTLVALATNANLSQPFLSQVENGRAQPSMMSLSRIAAALDTTPQAFFGGPLGDPSGPALLRAEEVRVVEVSSASSSSSCHLLLAGDAPFHVLEFHGLPAGYLEYWEHDGFEALYVIAGDVEVDIAGDITTLHAGDVLSYSSRLPHRMRSGSEETARVLLVETRVEAIQSPTPARHAPRGRGRRRIAPK